MYVAVIGKLYCTIRYRCTSEYMYRSQQWWPLVFEHAASESGSDATQKGQGGGGGEHNAGAHRLRAALLPAPAIQGGQTQLVVSPGRGPDDHAEHHQRVLQGHTGAGGAHQRAAGRRGVHPGARPPSIGRTVCWEKFTNMISKKQWDSCWKRLGYMSWLNVSLWSWTLL